jgi:hypothetical protein
VSSQRNTVFVSYSHVDSTWLSLFLTLLQPLSQHLATSVWSDRDIPPGAKWEGEIAEALKAARIAVLLVSPYFLASDFITQVELPALEEAAENGRVRILWFTISPCLYKHSTVANFQAVHDPERPLDGLSTSEANRSLATVANAIGELLLNDQHQAAGFAATASSISLEPFLRRPQVINVLANAGVALVLSLLTGISYRLWHEEAAFDSADYVVVFVAYAVFVALIRVTLRKLRAYRGRPR